MMKKDQKINNCSPKIVVVTACSKRKENTPLPAWELYKSSRIKAIYRNSKNCDVKILTAKYGLIDADEIIGPYDKKMDEKRARTLVSKIAKKLRKYDFVIYYKAGASKIYMECIKKACELLEKPLIVCGYNIIGGINDIPPLIKCLSENKMESIKEFKHVSFYNFVKT